MYYPSIRPTLSATISKVLAHQLVAVASSMDTATQRNHRSDAASPALSQAMGHLMNSMPYSSIAHEHLLFLHLARADCGTSPAVARISM